MLSVREIEDIMISLAISINRGRHSGLLEWMERNYHGQFHEMDAKNAANTVNHEIMQYRKDKITKETFAALYELRSRRPV
jgi:hypothetical protein